MRLVKLPLTHPLHLSGVHPPASNQLETFSEVSPLIMSVMDGYNVCIFAYGQTGSGKTHTMEGSDADEGINRRALRELFALAEKESGEVSTAFTLSALEVYVERMPFPLLGCPCPSLQYAGTMRR